jgi:hypothetical protein
MSGVQKFVTCSPIPRPSRAVWIQSGQRTGAGLCLLPVIKKIFVKSAGTFQRWCTFGISSLRGLGSHGAARGRSILDSQKAICEGHQGRIGGSMTMKSSVSRRSRNSPSVSPMGESGSKTTQGLEDSGKAISLTPCSPLSRKVHLFRASACARSFG